MHSTFAVMAGLASVALASPMPQGVTADIPPPTSAPAGCQASYDGKFEITAITPSVTKRSLEKRACGAPGSLTISLSNGVLKDAQDRTGYIADNFQFQFDGPPQAGAIYTSGFSVCGNGSLALGGSAIFYQCLSGDFYNLYDRSWAAQCSPILIDILPCAGGAPQVTPSPPTATQIGDGQVQASSAIAVSELPDGQPQMPTGLVSQIADGQIQKPTGTPITQIGDGQVQAPTGTPITQIGDGQVQAPTGTPITQIGDGQVQAPTGTPITQIGDGQIQAPTGTPITQIGDGQIQAPTGTPITQIGDGQIQAPTGTPITQIGDGQIQAPTGTPITQIGDGQIQAPTGAPITQIGDGQIQAPTGTAPATPVISQIGDGQIQAPTNNATVPTSPPVQVANGASNLIGSSLALSLAGVAAVLLL